MSNLKIYWFGYGGNAYLVNELRPIIEDLKMELKIISEWDEADIKWQRETWIQELRNADIIVLPSNFKEQPSKSNNKLTQALSLGKPVVASPLDAYKRVLENHPKSFLLAKNKEEWKLQLVSLRDDEGLRENLSKNALEAAKDFSLDSIGSKWLNLFNNLEKVDIIIPTYKNLRCLKLCLESVRKCTHVLYNLVVVNNGNDEETHGYLDQQGDIIYIRKSPLNFSQAINEGIRATNSKYVCFLNDDVIVSHGWLEKMANSCKGNVGIVNPFSNCDKGWKHNYDIKIKDIDLLPGVNTFGQVEPIVEDIYTYSSPYSDLKEEDWIAFYCTLISREVIQKVGLLDEKFQNSGEDSDFCFRAKKQGYKAIHNYSSFVFHFGAAGRKILEKENKEKYQKEQKETSLYLNEKWNKENVVIYTGPSWERWDFRNLKEGGIGGSETWAINLAREFSRDFRVKVFADCSESGIKDGEVEYLHYSEYPSYIDQNWIDYFITSRTTDTLDFQIRAGKVYVMIHDIWLLSDRNKIPLENVDKYCVLSEWHKDFVKGYHGIPEDKLLITSNGINLSRFDKEVEREPYRLIYSSSPDRGLDSLLYLFDFLKQEIPEIELHIFYGFDTWGKAIFQRGNEKEIENMKNLKKMMKKDGVFYHGRISQDQLAEEFLKSSLFAYPTDFEETFCISAIEAQRAGLPVISSNYCGLKTTVGDSAILIGNGEKGQSYTKEYRMEFVEKCMELLNDKEKWDFWSKKGLENSKKYSWDKVAASWKSLFKT